MASEWDTHKSGLTPDLSSAKTESGALESRSATHTPDPTVRLAERPLPVVSRDRYTLARELGRGGQSVVYLATDSIIGREVALKTQRDPNDADGRFVREARIPGQLEHPGIIPVYEIGADPDGRAFCTQKLVRGRVLRHVLEDCKTLNERLALLSPFIEVCNAVAYAHSRGVVHRDLKPDNVMIGEFGETVVLDWGVARVLGGASEEVTESRPLSSLGAGQTAVGTLVGTPLYMSPEQAQGKAIDPRSDVWSLGVMLYELLSGKQAFEAPTLQETLARVCMGEFPPLKQVCPDAPPELVAVVERALKVDPAARFRDARAVAKELTAYRDGARLSVYQYSSLELFRRFVRKNRTVTGGIAVAVLSLVVAVLIRGSALADTRRQLAATLTEQARVAENELDFARALELHGEAHALRPSPASAWGQALMAPLAPLRIAEPPLPTRPSRHLVLDRLGERALVLTADEALLYQGVTELGRWPFSEGWGELSADGKWVALPGSPSRLVQPGGEKVLPTEGKTLWAKFSNASDKVALGSADGTILLYAVETGALLRKLPPATGSRPSVIAFDARDERIAVGGQDGDIAIWSLASEAKPQLVQGRPHAVAALAFTPDGKQLLNGDYERFIDVFDLATGRMVLTSSAHVRSIFRFAFSPDGALLATASADGTVGLHTVEGLKPLGKLKATGAVLDVAFTSAMALRTVTTEGDVARWDLGPTVERLPVVNDVNFVIALAGSPDGKTIAFGTTGGSLGVRAWPAPAVRRKDDTHYHAAAFSPDGRRLGVTETDKVKVYQVEGAQLTLLEEHPMPCEGIAALGLALARDGTTWVSCGAKLLAGRGGVFTEQGLGNVGRYTELALSPDGKRLAWAGETRVLLYDVEAKKVVAEIELAVKARAVAFSPDSRLLAYGGYDRLAHVLDAATGKRLLRLEGHLSPVFDLAFAPDSRTIATASLDRSVRLWDAQTGEAVGRLPALNYEAMSVEWPAPGLIVVGDSAGTVTFSPIDRSLAPR